VPTNSVIITLDHNAFLLRILALANLSPESYHLSNKIRLRNRAAKHAVSAEAESDIRREETV